VVFPNVLGPFDGFELIIKDALGRLGGWRFGELNMEGELNDMGLWRALFNVETAPFIAWVRQALQLSHLWFLQVYCMML
jgi:hypothetical protein